MRYLKIDAEREYYSPADVEKPLTVQELKDFLEDCDPESPIILSFDDDYTFGTINLDKIYEFTYHKK